MFKSFGKSSSTKGNVLDFNRSSRNEKESDVQVEVSLDVFDKLYSIVVTENAALQSVVSVPTAETLNRHRKNHMMTTTTNVSNRSSGAFRPPAHSSKSIHAPSTNIKMSRSRGRESNSCPPPMNRGTTEKSLSTNITTRNRETSCPPPSSCRTDFEAKKSIASLSNAGKKSKDLVSKTASRSRFFGARRKSQVVPTATL